MRIKKSFDSMYYPESRRVSFAITLKEKCYHFLWGLRDILKHPLVTFHILYFFELVERARLWWDACKKRFGGDPSRIIFSEKKFRCGEIEPHIDEYKLNIDSSVSGGIGCGGSGIIMVLQVVHQDGSRVMDLQNTAFTVQLGRGASI
ncbi:hypothetical protein IEQ34_004057 [Dendrobium chrysotoxum]|uniref:Uncharacterized protein n=1 Tax=Dendrobium chrysotoxum TaxID=161865 RepID=A0AAV7HG63_DENCH|nr:hypothetical protein IEQ34_004057 [Dendrobium chrysotoxum]